MIDFLQNLMLGFFLDFMDPVKSTRRCRVPAMIGAMPIDVHRTKMPMRFGLGHARLRSF